MPIYKITIRINLKVMCNEKTSLPRIWRHESRESLLLQPENNLKLNMSGIIPMWQQLILKPQIPTSNLHSGTIAERENQTRERFTAFSSYSMTFLLAWQLDATPLCTLYHPFSLHAPIHLHGLCRVNSTDSNLSKRTGNEHRIYYPMRGWAAPSCTVTPLSWVDSWDNDLLADTLPSILFRITIALSLALSPQETLSLIRLFTEVCWWI